MQIHSSGSAFSALKAAPKAALQFGNADAFARFQTAVEVNNLGTAGSMLKEYPEFTNKLCANGETPFTNALIGAIKSALPKMDLSGASWAPLFFKAGQKPTEESFRRAMQTGRLYVDMMYRQNLAALREFEAGLRAEFGLRKRAGWQAPEVPVTLPAGL